jgi:hypothetical protein
MGTETRVELDVIGVLAGTDKSSSVSFAWDYLRHYQSHFERFRDEPINMMEIGVLGGSSLKVWKTWFSQATIVGVDIDPACARFAEGRVVIEIGSQEDPGFLARISAAYPPSIIIDDGSHRADHIVYTFERLFPALEPGGIYIVEDVSFHYGLNAPGLRGTSSISVPDYFGEFVQYLLSYQRPSADDWGTKRYICENIDEISIIRGAIVIRKRHVGRDFGRALATAEPLMSFPAAANRLSGYLIHHGGPINAAEDLARNALTRDGIEHASIGPLLNILVRTNRVLEAADLARKSAEAKPDDVGRWVALADVCIQAGDLAASQRANEKALALAPNDLHLNYRYALSLEHSGDLTRMQEVLQTVSALAEKQLDRPDWDKRLQDIADRVARLAKQTA